MATPEERAAYLRAKKHASIPIYFKDEPEKAKFQEMARRAGYLRFNAWVIDTLLAATGGQLYPPDYVDSLVKENAKHRAWLEQKDVELVELRKELRLSEQARADMRVVLATLAREHPEAARLAHVGRA